jgi:hypothetical protein
MRSAILIAGIVMAFVIIMGCLQTPGQVSQSTKAILNNTSIIGPETVPTITQPTFGPLKTSSAYVPRTAQTTAPQFAPVGNKDPIVGRWVLSGQNGYNCDATFGADGSGSADCNSFLVPLFSKSFNWENIGQDVNQSFMTDYNITAEDGTYYSAQFSGVTHAVYSTILPDNTYLVEVAQYDKS